MFTVDRKQNKTLFCNFTKLCKIDVKKIKKEILKKYLTEFYRL